MTTDKRPWEDTSRGPRERAEALVAAMTLEQKIAQLHGNLETIDIYSIEIDLGDEDAAANMFEVKRHVAGIDELGIPRMRVTNGPVGSAWATGWRRRRPRRCR